MDFEGAGSAVVLLFLRLVRLAELVVQADAQLMQVVLRIVACRRRGEGKAAEAEVGVEILDPRRPARIETVVDAAAQHVAQPDVAGVGVLIAGREVDSREARAGPRDAAGDEGRPSAHVVADAAAQARQPLELFAGRPGVGGAVRQDLRVVEIVGKGSIELDAQHQPRREVMLVADLHAAEQPAIGRGAAGRGDSSGRIAERGVGIAEQVADMAADVEAAAVAPIVGLGASRAAAPRPAERRWQDTAARCGPSASSYL